MKKEIKKYTTVCDICEQELFDSGVRSNDGRFEEPYFNRFDIDLCYDCAGKLFTTQIDNKLSEEKLTEMAEKTRKRIGFSSSFSGIELDDLLPTGGFIDTNSADTLFCSNDNETSETPEEKAMNGMFKVHPESEIKFQTSKDIDGPKNLKDL